MRRRDQFMGAFPNTFTNQPTNRPTNTRSSICLMHQQQQQQQEQQQQKVCINIAIVYSYFPLEKTHSNPRSQTLSKCEDIINPVLALCVTTASGSGHGPGQKILSGEHTTGHSSTHFSWSTTNASPAHRQRNTLPYRNVLWAAAFDAQKLHETRKKHAIREQFRWVLTTRTRHLHMCICTFKYSHICTYFHKAPNMCWK